MFGLILFYHVTQQCLLCVIGGVVAVAQQVPDPGQSSLRFGACVGVTCRQKEERMNVYTQKIQLF